MIPKELDDLIKEYLTDGIISEAERRVLLRKAEKMGLDIDEIDLYITAQEQKVDNKVAADKKAAIGKVCPKCGRQVESMTLRCECGYEFKNEKAVSSVQLLSEKLDKIIMSPMKNNDPDSDEYKGEKQNRYKQYRDTITMFPVPNTKEDIIEFLALSAPNSKMKGGILGTVKGRLKIAAPIGCLSIIVVCIGFMALFAREGAGAGLIMGLFYGAAAAYGVFHVCLKRGTDVIEENKTAEVWRNKFDQVLMKGRGMRGDAEFQQQLDYYDSLFEN